MEIKEGVEALKTEVPKFFINFIGVLTSPSEHSLSILKKAKSKESALAGALVYFTLCGVVGQAFQIPMYGMDVWKEKNLIYSLAAPIIFLFLSAMGLKFSWQLAGYKLPYWDYFVLICYQLGTFFIILVFLMCISLSFLKSNDVKKYTQEVNFTYLKKGSPVDYEVSNPTDLIYIILMLTMAICTVGWFFYSWSMYRNYHGVSRGKSIWIMLVFMVFFMAVYYIDTIIETGLRPN